MSLRSLSVPVAVALLAGCSAQTPSTRPAAPPAPIAEPTSCGAEEFAAYVGRQASEDVIAAIRAKHGNRPMRVLRPGTAVTMDYRAERLNLSVDASGRITGFGCS